MVKLLKTVQIANAWLLQDSLGHRFLIDTGYFTDRAALRIELWLAGVRRKKDLTAVLLTHRHSDHAANAAWLRKTFDAPVYCHENDALILQGKLKAPKMAIGKAPLYQEWLNHFEDRFPAKSVVDETFSEGLWKFGFHILPTPGHTEGSAMLYHEPTKALFSGDSILSGVPPLRSIEHLSLAMNGFSQDMLACHCHVKKHIEGLPPTQLLCSGHGPLVKKDTLEKLKRLTNVQK